MIFTAGMTPRNNGVLIKTGKIGQEDAIEYFCEELGEAGVGSRAAVGVSSLPGDAPVEISIVAGAGK